MKKYTDEQIVNIYLTECEIVEHSTLNGEYKKNNAAGKTLQNIFKYLENNLEQAEKVLHTLLNSRNVVVRCKAAAHCLSLSILQKEALKVLVAVSEDSSLGIFEFNAKMTLQVYQKQGFLKVYPSQKIMSKENTVSRQ